jgi:hypothetical protein
MTFVKTPFFLCFKITMPHAMPLARNGCAFHSALGPGWKAQNSHFVCRLGDFFQQAAIDDAFNNLHGVEGGTFAEVVGHNPEVQTIFNG